MKYVVIGEKGKIQMVSDSKDDIVMTITELQLQKTPINFTQVNFIPFYDLSSLSCRSMTCSFYIWANCQIVVLFSSYC